VHDEQSALTPARIADIGARFAARHPGRRLSGVQFVDSRNDPQVQVADLIAGVARRLGRDILNRRVDGELGPLLIPMVDPESVWADSFWSA
jgi:hypothetical protein